MLGTKLQPSSVLLLLGITFITATCADTASSPDLIAPSAAVTTASVSRIRITGGNNQSGTVGTVLPQKLTVQALHGSGPVPGAVVKFTVFTGGGSVSPSEVVTDEFGMASTSWTLGPAVGTNRVRVSSGSATPLVFRATATASSAPPPPPPPPAVATVVLTPSAITLDSVGARSTLTATTYDSNGQVVAGQNISWSSSNPLIASVDSTGLVVANSAGTAHVIASAVCCNKADTSTITVNSAPPPPPPPSPVLTTITLSPTSATIAVGATQLFTATARDQNGNVMTGVSYTWSSSNTGVMTVSQGTVTGVAAGVATVRATSGSVSGSAQVTVNSPPPPPPPGSFSPPDIAFTNMENGTTSPFTTSSGSTTGNADIVIMNDPTGAFGGKVARMRFARLSTAASPDVNRSLRYVHSTGVGLGQTVFIRGHVLVPTPAANMAGAMRKLFYVQRQPNDASFMVVKLQGNSLKAEITGNRVFSFGTVPFDRRVSIEIQITGSSAVGAANGTFRVWLDGALVLDRSDINWFTSSAPFKAFLFGQQAQHQLGDTSVLFDEYRYWDNLALSTKRIGP